MKKFVAVFAAFMFVAALAGPVFAQAQALAGKAPAVKGTEGPDVRKVEPKGTEGPDVRKAKKKTASSVKPKGTEGPDVQPTGKKAVITAATGRRLITLDNRPALEVYQEWTVLPKEQISGGNILVSSTRLPLVLLLEG